MGYYVQFREFLKQQLPDKIWVQRKRLPCDIYGQTYEIQNGWMIEIRNDLSEDSQIDVLIHEASHVIGRTMYHGREFGLAYTKAYKIWLNFCKVINERKSTGQVVRIGE